jgi:hypothetical protein
MTATTSWVMNLCGFIACGFLGALAVVIIIWIATDKIDIRHLLSEANGQGSMSRFQLLIFTFVVAIGIFELIEKSTPPGFPAIPDGILTLLGISASTYAVGKGISYSQPSLMKPPGPEDVARAEAAANKAEGHAADAQAAADQSASSAAAAAQKADG